MYSIEARDALVDCQNSPRVVELNSVVTCQFLKKTKFEPIILRVVEY